MHNGYMSKAHLTAISRKKLSSPAQYLHDQNLLSGRILDYGSGRGFDADQLNAEKFDPYYAPHQPFGKYETIYCNFVLNVIEDEDMRLATVFRIWHLLQKGGTAYISVRNDKRALKGRTSKGTWQGFIQLDLPIQKQNASFVMYKITK